MKNIIRTAAAAAAFTVVGVGLAGVAGAQEYVPDSCVEVVDGVETACVAAETVTDPAVDSVAATDAGGAVDAVSVSGTLPYTGNDSSLPLAEAGVALVAAGGAMLLVVKRRQASADS